jgi:hypothetical protein
LKNASEWKISQGIMSVLVKTLSNNVHAEETNGHELVISKEGKHIEQSRTS